MILTEKFLLPPDIDDAQRQAIVRQRVRKRRGWRQWAQQYIDQERGLGGYQRWLAAKRKKLARDRRLRKGFGSKQHRHHQRQSDANSMRRFALGQSDGRKKYIRSGSAP
jgi:hypothetical protein